MVNRGGQEPAPAEVFGSFDQLVKLLDESNDLMIESTRRFVTDPSTKSRRLMHQSTRVHYDAYRQMIEAVLSGDEDLETKVATITTLTGFQDQKRGEAFNSLSVSTEFETTTPADVILDEDTDEDSESGFKEVKIIDLIDEMGEGNIASMIRCELPDIYQTGVDSDIGALIDMCANPAATRRLDRQLEIRDGIKTHGLDILKTAVGAALGYLAVEQLRKRNS